MKPSTRRKYKAEIEALYQDKSDISGAQIAMGIFAFIFLLIFPLISIILFIVMCFKWARLSRIDQEIRQLEREIRLER